MTIEFISDSPFESGSYVKLEFEVYDPILAQYVDPVNVTLDIIKPDGNSEAQIVKGSMENPSTGKFYYNYRAVLPTGFRKGTYYATFEGSSPLASPPTGVVKTVYFVVQEVVP